jgi:CBS domain-containing protein
MLMDGKEIDDELKEMYEEGSGKPKVLNSDTLKIPIKMIPVLPPIIVERGSSALDAAKLMQEEHVGCVLVVDKGKLDGIFTERDILMKAVGSGKDLKKTKVEEVMTPNPETLEPDDILAYALNYMHLGGYRHVPVVDDRQHPVGVVSVKNVVDYLADYFPQEVLTLPPRPIRTTKEREGA